jgi:hypothetical protein
MSFNNSGPELPEFPAGPVNAGKEGVRELSAEDIDAVAGGTIMDIIVRAWMNAECLKRLTREGTVIDCSYPARP